MDASDNVKYYLANAYYEIECNITLDNTMLDLGGTGGATVTMLSVVLS